MMNDLFAYWVKKKSLELYHPKVVALQAELEKFREKVDEAPKGVIEISIPITVQTDTATWTKDGIKRDDGSLVLMVELQAYQKTYTVKQTDTSVVFF